MSIDLRLFHHFAAIWSLPMGSGSLPGEDEYLCAICGNDELKADTESALIAELTAERTARKALEEALWSANHDCCNIGHTKSDQHSYDDPCPVEARIVAALTLAAKLP